MKKYIFSTIITASLLTVTLTGCESKAKAGTLAGEAIETGGATEGQADRAQQLSIQDVINMHRANISDDKIINLIKNTNSRYDLTTRDIDTLQRAGVPNNVINHMMRS